MADLDLLEDNSNSVKPKTPNTRFIGLLQKNKSSPIRAKEDKDNSVTQTYKATPTNNDLKDDWDEDDSKPNIIIDGLNHNKKEQDLKGSGSTNFYRPENTESSNLGDFVNITLNPSFLKTKAIQLLKTK